MFKKNICRRCKKKVDEKYSFCPYCGYKNESDSNEDDWGMLGKDDFMSQVDEMKLPLGFNTLFNSLMKNLSKEFEGQLNTNYFGDDKKPKKTQKGGVSISISTFGNGQPRIKVTPLGNKQNLKPEKINEKFKQTVFTKENIKKFANLKKEEPKTEIRRLSSKVIYEIELPGVKSMEDISILKLESGIEIKAISKNKAYVKTIPINLPIEAYNLSEEKLTLELGIKN